MLQRIIDICPDEIWHKDFAGVPFWQEAYHLLFWLSHYTRHKGRYHPEPFGIDVYPMFDRRPSQELDKDTLNTILASMRKQIRDEFEQLDDKKLCEADDFENLGTIIKRLLNGIRHAQHHIGKLTGYLYLSKIDFQNWSY